jgi:ceramide glucosyltransferase
MALIGALILEFGAIPSAVLAVALAARLLLKWRLDRLVPSAAGPYWLLPVRDVVSFLVYLCSFFGRSIDWRGEQFIVGTSGALSQS